MNEIYRNWDMPPGHPLGRKPGLDATQGLSLDRFAAQRALWRREALDRPSNPHWSWENHGAQHDELDQERLMLDLELLCRDRPHWHTAELLSLECLDREGESS